MRYVTQWRTAKLELWVESSRVESHNDAAESEAVPFAQHCPDGRRVLTRKQDATDERIVVVTNWTKRARARIAEAKSGK